MTEGLRSASNRLYTLATRATLPSTPDDTQLFQELTASGFAGEVHTKVEHPTSYGFAHMPIAPTGQQAAEIFMVYLGASRSNPVAMLVGDRRYRLGKMSEGDVAHYTRSTMQSHFVDGKGHVRSVPNTHYHRHQIMQAGDKVGTLNSIAPFGTGQDPWALKIPHSYKHIAAALMQNQHPHQINHHIISGPAVPPNLTGALTSMSGISGQIGSLAGQIATMATAGLGLPGINAIGSQILALASQITGSGVTPAMTSQVGQILAGATTASTAVSTTGIAAIAARIQSLATNLQGMMGAGGMSQIVHKREANILGGILHSAFQGQHATQHGISGIVAASIAQIAHNAPLIPHNGNASVSDQLTVTKDVLSPLYNILSDHRLKSNVSIHEPVLDKLLSLQVKTFDVALVNHHPNLKTLKFDQSIHGDPPRPSVGLIAQELRKVFPRLVHGNEAEEFLSISEHKIGVLVLQGLQEFVVETRQAIKELRDGHSAH